MIARDLMAEILRSKTSVPWGGALLAGRRLPIAAAENR
jgi:hypothetical protein